MQELVNYCSLVMHHKLVESNIGWKALALQCNFLFYLFASSGLALPKVLMKCLFDYFWKPISPFSKFCVNCLLRLYFVYCNICVLNVVHRACYCTCSLMAVRVPEKCFWPAQTKKNLFFLRCLHVFDLVLKYCSDLNEGNWLQLLFHFFVLMGIFALVIGLSFFNCVLGFRLKFSRIAVSGKCLQLESKTVLTMIGFFWSFLLKYAPFRRLHVCMD